jgi:hypothetical protein
LRIKEQETRLPLHEHDDDDDVDDDDDKVFQVQVSILLPSVTQIITFGSGLIIVFGEIGGKECRQTSHKTIGNGTT